MNAAISAGTLSELTLMLGNVKGAVGHGDSSVVLADRSGESFPRVLNRTTLGDAKHAGALLADAETDFREAESIQVEWQPKNSMLYSLQGFRFCDLLLGKAAPLDGSGLSAGFSCNDRSGIGSAIAELTEQRNRCEEVRKRAKYCMVGAERHGWPLDIALAHLSLGRAYLGLALADGRGFNDASNALDRAIWGLLKAGQEDDLPRGLIARAMLHRFCKDVSAAEADLDEALEIAERGSMRLHECDAYLEWGRLRCSVDDLEGARTHLEKAATLVENTGYHRRDRELAELRAALESAAQ